MDNQMLRILNKWTKAFVRFACFFGNPLWIATHLARSTREYDAGGRILFQALSSKIRGDIALTTQLGRCVQPPRMWFDMPAGPTCHLSSCSGPDCLMADALRVYSHKGMRELFDAAIEQAGIVEMI